MSRIRIVSKGEWKDCLGQGKIRIKNAGFPCAYILGAAVSRIPREGGVSHSNFDTVFRKTFKEGETNEAPDLRNGRHTGHLGLCIGRPYTNLSCGCAGPGGS